MKTILHYINWALHDFNRACYYIIKNYLKFGLALLAMLLVSLPLLFFTDSEWAIGIYGIFLFFGSLFIAITWMIKHEKPETEEVVDHFGMVYTLTDEFEPKDWKQSVKSSAKWTLYALFLLFTSVIIFDFLNPDLPPEQVATMSPICPDDYPDTDEGSEMRIADTDVWTNTFFDNNPDATIEDWSEARRQFWADNNCTLALERYEAAISGEADMSEVDAIVNDMLSQ